MPAPIEKNSVAAQILVDGQPITPEVRAELERAGVEFNEDGEPVPQIAKAFVSMFKDELIARFLTPRERIVFDRVQHATVERRRHARAK